MRDFVFTIVAAIAGAVLALALVYAGAMQGLLPINDKQMQTYLMLHPELAMAMMGRQQQIDDAKEARAQVNAMKTVGQKVLFDPKLAFLVGPVDAKNSLVEFYDYDCPYCRASLPSVMKYVAAHRGDTRFAFIEFPIASLHGPGAVLAAKASLAARLQPDHYLPFHFAMMSEEGSLTEASIYADATKAGLDIPKLKADMRKPEIQTALDASGALAHKLGIDGTPTFVANGAMHPGMVDDGTLADMMKGQPPG